MELTRLALLDSTLDPLTTRHPIPILSTGHCSLASELYNGIRYVSMQFISMEFTSLMGLVFILVLLDLTPDFSTARYLISILSMGHCLLGLHLYNSIRYVPT